MSKKQTAPVHLDWRKGDVVDIGSKKGLIVIDALHDDRCSTFALEASDGSRYRYVPTLKLHRTN